MAHSSNSVNSGDTGDDVVKAYDRVITARILSYVKPYPVLVVVTVIALGCATVGELAVPVIQQRVIDGHILARFFSLNDQAIARQRSRLSPAAAAELEALLHQPGVLSAGGQRFVPRNQDATLSGSAEKELTNAGIVDPNQWYAFPITPGDPRLETLRRHNRDFLWSDTAAALLTTDLYTLPLKDITAIRAADLRQIIRAAWVLLGMLGVVFCGTFAQTWATTLLGQQVMKDIRLALFQKTASQSSAFLSSHPVGRIVTRLTGDVETINEFFSSVLVALLKDLAIMAGVLITLFMLSPRLAGVTVLTLPPVLIVTAVSRVKARDAFRRQRTASSKVNTYLSERLSGIAVVQLFRGERRSSREFGSHCDELLDANLGEMYVFATFRPLVEWFSVVTTAMVLVAGASLALQGSVSLGVVIAFINLVGMFYAPVMDIAEKYTLLQSAMAGGERVFALLDTDARIPDTGAEHPVPPHAPIPAPAPARRITGHIVFQDVWFSYKHNEPVLKGLSFTVKPGEMAAIVGYTGAGKTTITSVLARLWDIDSGAILLDGIPVQQIPLDELRQSVLPVLQDVFLFSGTVADNIRLGLDLTDAQVEAAAQAVYAHDFIAALPQGYQTVLSEGATNISSGQRQLISFARVVAHNPSVVILDEATSSVDTETERRIQLGLQQVLAGRTSIVIAHRLSTIRNADRILVLSNGRLVEEGGHDTLLAKKGLYATLYRLQYQCDGDSRC